MAAETVMTFVGENETLKLSKEDLDEAKAVSNTEANFSTVFFRLSENGNSKFANFTKSHINKKVDLKICGETVASPIIREPIYSGTGAIGSIKTIVKAKELANILNTGICD